MNIKRSLAGMLAGGLVAGAALVAVAGPAAAIDEGTLLPGGIGWFSAAGPLADQSPATQVFGGTGTARPWVALTTENPCPTGTTQMYTYVRIPQVGVPENDWTQVQLGASNDEVDADGRFYSDTTAPRMQLTPDVQTYNAAHGGAGDFPFLAVCRDDAGLSLGYFQMTVHIAGVDPNGADSSWSIVEPAWHVSAPASSTALTASASSITYGDPVDLTATVTPASATGDVQFLAGTTDLGTATLAGGVATLTTTTIPVGTQQVTARYLGGSHAASTSAAVQIVVAGVPAADTTTTLAVDVVDGEPYQDVTLTATVAPAAAAGVCEFYDGLILKGTVPVAGGVAAYTVDSFGPGTHSLTAVFVPADAGLYTSSTSAAVAVEYVSSAVADEQTVVVTIPVGAITITTPYTPGSPLDLGLAVYDPADSTYSASAPFDDIVINDTRVGSLGFTASVVAGDFTNGTETFGGQYAGLTDLVATQVTGNALLAADVVLTDNAPVTPGLATPQVFATHAAGLSIGTARIDGVFQVDQVPTSVVPGQFTSTVTFSVI